MDNSKVKIINHILNVLNYTKSNNLYYYKDFIISDKIDFHYKKIIKQIKPYAIFTINNQPFILFFDNDENKELNKKIWNSQTPIVVFVDTADVKIYNGLDLNYKNKELKLLKKQLIKEIDEQNDFSYWNVTNKNYWTKFEKQYNVFKLNELLLQNIKYLSKSLTKMCSSMFATKLTLRIVFIRFLIDRGVDIGYSGLNNNIEESNGKFLEIVSNKNELYKLFSYLKNKFNGNLFDISNEDITDLQDDIFTMLKEFLSGNIKMDNGQLTLFPLYDFNIVPVELISNIFEFLLGEEKQKDDKAFYTPLFLVDYILNGYNIDRLEANKYYKILDPSCGSGIFLVEFLKKIIEKNCDINGFINNHDQLLLILKNCIFGIDKNEEAIDITIFSLYLVLFDYIDPKKLDDFKLPNIKGENLFVSDFFDERRYLKITNIKFDYIIGNPPWGNIKNGLHNKYMKENNYPQQNNEIARSFMIKITDFCSNNTQCCLIIPSKILYNKSKQAVLFRKLILSKFDLIEVVELSTVRKQLFKNAIAPAAIIKYKISTSENHNNKFKHISLKPNIFFKLFKIVVIEKNDVKYIQQKSLINDDWIWKLLLYGTNFDYEIIKNLLLNYSTLNDYIKEYKLINGTGIMDNVDKKHKNFDSTYYIGQQILDSKKSIDHFYINFNNTEIFNKKEVHRPRNKILFDPPNCLVPIGIECSSYRIKAAFNDKRILYKRAITGIKGNINQEKILLNIVGIMNSSLYAYLNLMLASSLGIEREQLIFEEVLNYPMIYNDDVVKLTEKLQKIKKDIFNNNEYETNLKALDKLVLKIFGLEDNPFIDYAINVQIPMLTDKKFKYKTVNNTELTEYTKIFFDYFEKILSPVNKSMEINICYDNNYVMLEGTFKNSTISEKLKFQVDKKSEFLSELMLHKINDNFYELRDVVFFEKDKFIIIKSSEFKNWHKASAIIDLNHVINKMTFYHEEV